ncbi:molybdopterin molybdenumtransferase MoeA, partial [Rhodobacteraceae bacterium]|nr:molybdopterin molybdenumtransferase MoeA [Paracoccaceae bacterium]
MIPYDSFCMVDWSGGNDTGPTPRKDAIWAGAVLAGVEQEPVYLRNRVAALDWLTGLIESERSQNRRLFIGFDFPFGYPKGFARVVTGSDDPFELWKYLANAVVDTPKANNRFKLAGAL